MQFRACCPRDFRAFCAKTPRGTVAPEQYLNHNRPGDTQEHELDTRKEPVYNEVGNNPMPDISCKYSQINAKPVKLPDQYLYKKELLLCLK